MQPGISFWDAIVLQHEPIDGFLGICYLVYLWHLVSSILIHSIASVLAFISLRKHKIARYGPMVITLSSIVTPLFSFFPVIIAFVYRTSSFKMYPIYAMCWGCGLTLLTAIFSFSRVLATLWYSYHSCKCTVPSEVVHLMIKL